jgi:putative ABC transport system permease protein
MWAHLRYSLRHLKKAPGFTLIAIAMIGLGIGMSTSAFSITNCILLRSANFPDSDQLVRVFRTSTRSKIAWHSPANFLYVRAAATCFSSLATFVPHQRNVTEKGQIPDPEPGLYVTANFLSTLGVQPILGRGLAPDEDLPGKSKVALLTETYWKHRFGGDSGIIGRTLRVGFDDVTVVGILPDFEAPSIGYRSAWVVPETIWGGYAADRNAWWFEMVGRLKAGVSHAQAQAELSALAARIDHDHPKENGNDGMVLLNLAGSDVEASQRQLYWLSTGLSTLVLLIACANLASLQIARALGRGSEFAIRSSLGARRIDLMAPLLIESAVLTIAGTLAGLLLGSWSNQLVSHFFWDGYPIPIDARVLLFALVVSLVTGLIFGLAPAWLASRASTERALRENSRGSTAGRDHHRLKDLLVAGQLASALVLVSAALSLAVAARNTMTRGLGWEPEGLFSAFVDINNDTYGDDAKKVEFVRKLRDQVAQIPGVAGVTVATQEPLYGYFAEQRVMVAGEAPVEPGREQPVQATAVDSSYFRLLGISLKAGDVFDSSRKAGDPKQVVINEAMARHFWPGASPIGKRIRFADDGTWNEVIGVVGDVRMAAGFDSPYSRLQVYRVIDQSPSIHNTLIVKSSLPPESLLSPVRKVLAGLNPDLMLQNAGGVEEVNRKDFTQTEFMIATLGSFALVGLMIALLGLYGVIMQLTLQRNREIGIRIALGATHIEVIRLIFSQGARLLLWGTILGLLGAYAVSALYSKTMPELRQPGLAFEALITALLCLAGLVACYLPARVASRIDPVIALRAE